MLSERHRAALLDCEVTGDGRILWDLEIPYRIPATNRVEWLHSTGYAEHRWGRLVRLVGAVQRVTERKLVEQDRARNYNLRLVPADIIADAVISTDRHGLVSWLNPIAERMTGWSLTDARGRASGSIFRISNGETGAHAQDPVLTCLIEKRGVGLEDVATLTGRDGRRYGVDYVAQPIRDAEGTVLGGVLVFVDVTEARHQRRAMTQSMPIDPPKRLVDGPALVTHLSRVLKRGSLAGENALLYVQLAHFERIKASCPPAVIDALIADMTKILFKSARLEDTIAQLAPARFGVLLHGCGPEAAIRVAQAVRERVQRYRLKAESRLEIDASIGLVSLDAVWGSPREVLKAAHTACQDAMRAGRSGARLPTERPPAQAPSGSISGARPESK